MEKTEEIPAILATVDDFHIILPVSSIRYIIQAVAVAPMPDTPDYVVGLMNYHGEMLPVISLTAKFGKPATSVSMHQFFAIVTGEHAAAIILDQIEGHHIFENGLQSVMGIRTEKESIITAAQQINGITYYLLNTEKLFTSEDAATLFANVQSNPVE